MIKVSRVQMADGDAEAEAAILGTKKIIVDNDD